MASVQRAGVLNAVGFNYRRLPAVSLMKRMIDEGAVGKVRLWRATWLSDEFVDPAIPFDWRFDRAVGGSTIADLGSHLIDLAMWMVGGRRRGQRAVGDVRAARANPHGGGSQPVTVDDASSALVRFESGARGVFEMARTAVRRPCDFTIEVNGESGTLVFEYARLNELLYGDGADAPGLYGMRRIRAEHETPSLRAQLVADRPGRRLRRELRQPPRRPARALAGRDPGSPTSSRALAVQAVCEAIERAASASDRWVKRRAR